MMDIIVRIGLQDRSVPEKLRRGTVQALNDYEENIRFLQEDIYECLVARIYDLSSYSELLQTCSSTLQHCLDTLTAYEFVSPRILLTKIR